MVGLRWGFIPLALLLLIGNSKFHMNDIIWVRYFAVAEQGFWEWGGPTGVSLYSQTDFMGLQDRVPYGPISTSTGAHRSIYRTQAQEYVLLRTHLFI